MTKIADALKKLDNSKATDWAENGSPSLNRVQVLMKDSSITQEQLDEAAGDLRREEIAGKKKKKFVDPRDPATAADLESLIDPETGQFQLMEDHDIKNKDTGDITTVQRRKKVFVKNMHVAAVERGFANGAIRDPGDTFMYTGELGTWMMPGDHARVAQIREEYAKVRAESLNPAPVPMAPNA
jgi:hypothetical protein